MKKNINKVKQGFTIQDCPKTIERVDENGNSCTAHLDHMASLTSGSCKYGDACDPDALESKGFKNQSSAEGDKDNSNNQLTKNQNQMKKITDSTAFKYATLAGAILVVGGAGYAIYKEGMTKKAILPAFMLLAGISAFTMAGSQVFGKPTSPVAETKKETKKEEETGEGA